MEKTLKILHIADHEAVENKKLSDELVVEGIYLDTIDDSPAFLEAAEYDNYDCIVYEGSEVTDGSSLLKTIREKSKDATVVFTTKGAVDKNLAEAIQNDGHARIELDKQLPSLIKDIHSEPGIARSIQKEKQELLLSNKVANIIPQSVIAIDDDGRILFVNQTSLTTLGYSKRSELTGRPILKLFPLAKNNDGLADIRKLLSDEDRATADFQWKMVGSAGEYIEVAATCVPFQFQQQSLTALVFKEEKQPDLAEVAEPVVEEKYQPKNILVISDGLVMKSGLQLLFKEEKDSYEFLNNQEDLISALSNNSYDALLYSTSLVDENKYNAIVKIREAAGDIPVMIASLSAEESAITEMIKAGAAGMIYSEKEFQDIPHALRMISDGAIWYSKKLLPELVKGQVEKKKAKKASRADSANLTNREREVLNFLAQGYKNKKIADELGLSYRTVVTHVYNIYRKLKISSRTEAIHYAISNRLIDVDIR